MLSKSLLPGLLGVAGALLCIGMFSFAPHLIEEDWMISRGYSESLEPHMTICEILYATMILFFMMDLM
jgi:hypothetical protein